MSGAAREAGVQSRMFGIFHDAGYKGLYGGLGAEAIKHRKGIPENDQLMDRMDTTELAANQFRMTQTRDKLRENASVIKNTRFRRTIRLDTKSARPSSELAVHCPRTCPLPNTSSRLRSGSSTPHRGWNWTAPTPTG